jgi:hypothetical protein
MLGIHCLAPAIFRGFISMPLLTELVASEGRFCFPQTGLLADGFVVTMRSERFGDYRHGAPDGALASFISLKTAQGVPWQAFAGTYSEH